MSARNTSVSRPNRHQVLAPTLVDRLPLRKTAFAEDDVLTKCWEGSDGRWFMAMMPFRADHFWPLLCKAIGRAEWASMYDARDRWDVRALECDDNPGGGFLTRVSWGDNLICD